MIAPDVEEVIVIAVAVENSPGGGLNTGIATSREGPHWTRIDSTLEDMVPVEPPKTQFCKGEEGWAKILTVYLVPDGYLLANWKLPLEFRIMSSSASFTWSVPGLVSVVNRRVSPVPSISVASPPTEKPLFPSKDSSNRRLRISKRDRSRVGIPQFQENTRNRNNGKNLVYMYFMISPSFTYNIWY
jgi:hypothetical protein